MNNVNDLKNEREQIDYASNNLNQALCSCIDEIVFKLQHPDYRLSDKEKTAMGEIEYSVDMYINFLRKSATEYLRDLDSDYVVKLVLDNLEGNADEVTLNSIDSALNGYMRYGEIIKLSKHPEISDNFGSLLKYMGYSHMADLVLDGKVRQLVSECQMKINKGQEERVRFALTVPNKEVTNRDSVEK